MVLVATTKVTYKKAAHSKTGAAFLWLGDKPV
jgi:hypothetical protein